MVVNLKKPIRNSYLEEYAETSKVLSVKRHRRSPLILFRDFRRILKITYYTSAVLVLALVLALELFLALAVTTKLANEIRYCDNSSII